MDIRKMPDEIHPHLHRVSRSERNALKGHLPLVIWMTGLSGSGKSTIANALEHSLVHQYHCHTYLLDGDNVRSGLNAGLGFTEEDRRENIRRVGEVAKLMFDAGLIVITAFISPFRADRDMVRALFGTGEFWEVYIHCPLATCQERDPKGLYRKALAGELNEFTGITSPYEVPDNAELTLNTEKVSVDTCVDMIIERLLEKNIITRVA